MMMPLNVANVEQKELKICWMLVTAAFTFVLLILPEDLSQNIRIYPLRIINDIYSQFFLFVFQWKYSFKNTSINVFFFFFSWIFLPDQIILWDFKSVHSSSL